MRKAQHAAVDTSSTAGTEFEASPSFLLSALGNRVSVSAERTLRRALDLSLMEWRVLSVLAVEPAAPPGRIIGVAGVNKAAVSRAVNSLEQRGYLRRAADPNHGLRTHLFLTRSGQALHDRGVVERDRAEGQLLRGLTAADRRRFSAMLRQVMRNLDEME